MIWYKICINQENNLKYSGKIQNSKGKQTTMYVHTRFDNILICADAYSKWVENESSPSLRLHNVANC